MNVKNRRACCLLRVILQGPGLPSIKDFSRSGKDVCDKVSSQWQNLLFKVSAVLYLSIQGRYSDIKLV